MDQFTVVSALSVRLQEHQESEKWLPAPGRMLAATLLWTPVLKQPPASVRWNFIQGAGVDL